MIHPVKESKVLRDEKDEEKERTTGVLGKETKAVVEEAEAKEVATGKTEVKPAAAVEQKEAAEEEAKGYWEPEVFVRVNDPCEFWTLIQWLPIGQRV